MLRAGSRTAARLAVLIMLLMPAAMVSVALAQTGDAPAGEQAAGESSRGGIDPLTGALPQLGDMFMFSPIINGIIAGLSVLAVMLFLFFMLTITPRAMVPPDFVDEVTKLVLRGKHEAVSDLCRQHRRVFIATVIQRCVDNAGKGHSVIMDMIDSEGRRRADIIWNRISYLADVANIAPMLGLLGTVLGMITAFFGLERETGSIDAAVLSQGVGQAMATTMFGLVVGITALTFYSIVKARTTRSLAEAEQAVHSITDHLKRDEADLRPSHAVADVAE